MAASSPTVSANGTATTATTPEMCMVFTSRGASMSEMEAPIVPAPAPALEKPRFPVRRSPSQMK